MLSLLAVTFAVSCAAQAPTWPPIDDAIAATGGGDNDAAVVVGVSNYYKLPRIDGAADNASAWSQYLMQVRKVPSSRVVTLRDDDATRERILSSARTMAAQVKPGGTLWFVFIGHGAPVPGGYGVERPGLRSDDGRVPGGHLLERQRMHGPATGSGLAAGIRNALISKSEETALDPVLQRAATAIRTEGGAGTRVQVDAVVNRAAADSVGVWGRFNANNHGRDGQWLSVNEAKEIARADPALGVLTEQALLRVRRGSVPTPTPVGALDSTRAAAFIASVDVSVGPALDNASRVDVRAWHAFTAPTRATVPAPILAAFDHYASAELADWASVALIKGEIDGKPAYAINVSTDGDEKYYEIFDDKGQGLASARAFDDGLIVPDAFFGRARLASSLFDQDQPTKEYGESEHLDRAAAGQPPIGWRGDVHLDAGAMHFDQNNRYVRVDLPGSLTVTPEQQQLLHAGLEMIAGNVMQHRASPGQPAKIGPQDNGTLSIGTFTRSTDGQSYEVAAWQDIDDASYVYYFQRDTGGQLQLKTIQTDG